MHKAKRKEIGVTQIVNALGVAEKIGGADFKIGANRISPDSTLRMLFDFDTVTKLRFRLAQPRVHLVAAKKNDAV